MNVTSERMLPMKSLHISALAAAVAVSACTTVKEEVKPEATVAAPTTVQAKTAKEQFAEGVSAFDAGRLDDAKRAFVAVAKKATGSAGVQYNLGLVTERQGELAEAVSYYEAAHRIDPKHKPTLLNLGRAYRLQDRFDDAIALYEEALKDPANEYDVELNNNLAVAYRLSKKFAQAEAAARRVLARTKDNPDAYKNLALIYFDQGNYRLAEFISANARKLDDKDPGVYNNLGLIYLKIDEPRMALGQFQKAVELKKDFAPGLFNMGAMALSYRDYDGAEKVLQQATVLDPTSYEGFLAYAWALDGQKGRDPKKGVEAGRIFERVLAIKPGQADAICGAAWAYASDKSGWDKALSFFENCKSLSSTTPQDQQLIDSKVKGIVAMQKAPAAAPAPEPEKPKAAPAAPQGPSLLDKVSDDAAAGEAEGAATGGSGDAQPATPAAQ